MSNPPCEMHVSVVRSNVEREGMINLVENNEEVTT